MTKERWQDTLDLTLDRSNGQDPPGAWDWATLLELEENEDVAIKGATLSGLERGN